MTLVVAVPILYVAVLLFLGIKCGLGLFGWVNRLLIFFDLGMAGGLRLAIGGGLSVFFFVLFVFLTRKPFIKIMKWLSHSIFGEGHLRDLLK
jgi:hypothetical protein